MDLVNPISQAIAEFEGYFSGGTLAARNNNPGNLRSGPRAIGTDAHGFAIYASAADGWADLSDQVQRNISRGLSLPEFFGGKPGVYPGYAPAADNNQPNSYAAFVAHQTGLPLDVPLSALAAGGDSPAASSSGGGAVAVPIADADAAFAWPSLTWGSSDGFTGLWPGWIGYAAAGVVGLWIVRRLL